jgi:hypothetical protein
LANFSSIIYHLYSNGASVPVSTPTNYRCLYPSSWLLLGILWSRFRLRNLIFGFIHRIVRIRRKRVYFSWEDFPFSIYCVVRIHRECALGLSVSYPTYRSHPSLTCVVRFRSHHR